MPFLLRILERYISLRNWRREANARAKRRKIRGVLKIVNPIRRLNGYDPLTVEYFYPKPPEDELLRRFLFQARFGYDPLDPSAADVLVSLLLRRSIRQNNDNQQPAKPQQQV